MVSRLWTVGLAALCCALLGVGSSYAQTLQVPLPAGCVPMLSAGAIICTGPVTPPAPPPVPIPTPIPPGGGFAACAAAGYAVQLVEIGYPLGANFRIDTGSGGPRFGNTDALVVHFRTPAVDPSGNASFSMIYRGGYPQVTRVATLGLSPCLFGAGFSLKVPATTRSQGPVFNTTLISNPFNNQYKTVLLPSTDYYITFVNRNDYTGGPSCTAADCAVFIDAN